MLDSSKPILILGGEGFVGSHLCELFPNAIPLDDRSLPKHKFNNTIVMDIGNPAIEKHIANAGLVLHAACRDIRYSMRFPLDDAKTNILGTLNVLMLCRKHKIPFFYISSVSVWSEVSHYAVSKSTGERYALMYRQWIPTAIVRLSNVFGPRDTESVVAKWLHDETITLVNPDATRDFTFYKDTIDGIKKAVEIWPQDIVNIGTGVETRLGELAKWISHKLDKPIIRMPAREIDNVNKRVVNPIDAEKKIGYRSKWKIYEALEETIKIESQKSK